MAAQHEALAQIVRAHMAASAAIKQQVAERCDADVVAGAALIADALRSGGRLLLCGNGGSAADCQHLAAEFLNGLRRDATRGPLAAIALTTDTSFLTACANDRSFEEVFARQVLGIGRAGDVLLGITTSGGSKNVVRAFEAARSIGVKTLALTGAAGVVGTTVDVTVAVPSRDTQYIQESHLAIEHLLCDLAERLLGQDGP